MATAKGRNARWLHGQALPQAGAATAPMLSEDGDGEGGAAPPKRSRQGQGSRGGETADPNQPKRHSIAHGRTLGNIQYWFGSAAVQQNIHEL